MKQINVKEPNFPEEVIKTLGPDGNYKNVDFKMIINISTGDCWIINLRDPSKANFRFEHLKPLGSPLIVFHLRAGDEPYKMELDASVGDYLRIKGITVWTNLLHSIYLTIQNALEINFDSNILIGGRDLIYTPFDTEEFINKLDPKIKRTMTSLQRSPQIRVSETSLGILSTQEVKKETSQPKNDDSIKCSIS